MRTLLTKMFRTPQQPIKTKARLNFVKLEERDNPAPFTFAGESFDTLNSISKYGFIPAGTFDGAIFTSEPSSAIEVGVGFPNEPGFPFQASIGAALFGGTEVRAVNLPDGNVGTNKRSGITANYTAGRAILNGPGADVILYESASSATAIEAFMIQAYNVNTGKWSPWFYAPNQAFQKYVGDPIQGAFVVTYDLTDLGFADGEYATKFRVANMTDADRMVSSTGFGVVIPNDAGATSVFRPNTGPLGGNTTFDKVNGFDPDPLYMGATNDLATNITNIRTTVIVSPNPPVAGLPLTYTVLIENLGSGDAGGINPLFTLSPDFIPVSITTEATGGATGNTTNPNTDTLTMPAESTVTYIITGSVAQGATSPLVSIFNGGLPAAPAIDPNLADNTATSTLGVVRSADVKVTIAPDGGPVAAGSPVTFTVVVTNNGPSDVNGVKASDILPGKGLTGVTYTSTSTGGATGNTDGSGATSDTLNLPNGSTVTYTITGTVPPDFSGDIPFTFNTVLPPDATDPTPGDGSKTVTLNATLTGDLFVTVTPNNTTPITGQKVTYTIVAANKGPSTATATLLTDNFSSAFSSVTFTSVASAGASGNTPDGFGDLNEVLTLPPNSEVTYTVVAAISPGVTGLITNTATLTPPPGFVDTDLSNNSMTAAITSRPGADVGLVVIPNTPVASLGGKMSYVVNVTNAGPANITGVKVASILDPNILGVTFTSEAFGGAGGNTTVGNGNIDDIVSIPAGAKITYVIGGTVRTGITGNLTSTFTATNPDDLPDPNPIDNTVTIVTPTQPSPKVIYAASTGFGVVTQVFVFNSDGTPRFSYQPYDTKFTRGVNVAIGDVNGDGFPDVVTGAATGGGSHVRAVDGLDGKDLFSFFAYGPDVRTGVVVTVDDINGDGREEIITGSDAGGGPRIRVFDMTRGGSQGKSILDFFAFDPSMNKGVRVASGNFDAGSIASEIAVSAGPGGPSDIRIFNGATGALLKTFQPFGNSTRGSWVAAADFDNNGIDEIVVGDDRGQTPVVRVFDPSQNFKQTTEFFAYETNFKGGTRVATYSDDSVSIVNPPNRILTGPGVGGGPRLRKFTSTGGDLGSQFLIGSFDRGGIYVG